MNRITRSELESEYLGKMIRVKCPNPLGLTKGLGLAGILRRSEEKGLYLEAPAFKTVLYLTEGDLITVAIDRGVEKYELKD